MGVGARGKVQDKLTGCYLTNPIDIQNKNKNNDKAQDNKNVKKEKTTPKKDKNSSEKGLTKLERKAKYNELKRTMKEVWTTEMESDEDKKNTQSLPNCGTTAHKNFAQSRRII